MSFKAEMHVAPGEWSSNALCFATNKEADQYGLDLLLRWTVPSDYRVVESGEAVNYKLVDNQLERIKG